MRRLISFLALMLGVGGNVVSGEETTASSGSISDETRMAMMQGAASYDECLRRESDTLMSDHADVRNVADAAMKRCDPVLDETGAALSKGGVEEGLRVGYLRHTRNTAVRRLLPALMARRAAEQTAAP